jgi:hypothetical protein
MNRHSPCAVQSNLASTATLSPTSAAGGQSYGTNRGALHGVILATCPMIETKGVPPPPILP